MTVQHDGIVCCSVGDERYALRALDVRHITRAERMRRGAGDDGSVGTLEIGAQTLPVFSMRRALGCATGADATPATAGRHLAVTGDGEQRVAWLVDRIARTPVAAGASVVPLPSIVGEPATGWFEAVIGPAEQSLLLIAPHRLDPRFAASCAAVADATPAFEAPPATRSTGAAEPTVLLFSSDALPRSEAERHAISGRQVAAVVQSLTVMPVPGRARHVAGVAWWRDRVVTVLDFRERADGARCHRRFIVAECGPRLNGMLVAFAIDDDIVIHRPGREDRQVQEAVPAFAAGVFDVGGALVALTDLDALASLATTLV